MISLCVCAIAVSLTYRNDFPLPIATTKRSQPNLRAKLTASTTTSYDNLLMTIFCLPCLTPSATCNSILVYASSCVHGDSHSTLVASEHSSSHPCVITTLPGNMSAVTLSLSMLNSSALLSCCVVVFVSHELWSVCR